MKPIKKGDCIMEVPYDVQLTQDKLPGELRMLLDSVVDDTAKVAVLLMMVRHLGHESGWEPYVKSLPCRNHMHNMIFWDLNELHMVQNSSIYKEVLAHKDQAKKDFSAVKPLETLCNSCFSLRAKYCNENWDLHATCSFISSLADFKRCIVDFLNHDGFSNSILLYDEQKDVSEVIADRNYAVGEQVMIRYGKYSNATLALNFGFTLSRNIYDQAHICADMHMPEQDLLWGKKIEIWDRHHRPKSEDVSSCGGSKYSFVLKKSKFSKGKGMGVPEILRAFFRVFCATSLEDLLEMAAEAARNDGRLARCPLENVESEIQAHRMLLIQLKDKIQRYSTVIEELEIVNNPSFLNVHPFRKEMAKELFVGKLGVLQSAHSWVATYCENLSKS